MTSAQVAVPPLTGHVIDQTGTLSAQQKAALEQTLTAFEARKGSQLAVLMIASSAPEEIEQYALRVAEQWKLGRKEIDDGAILVVAKIDRAVRIEVGYGLEGVLGDLTSKRIISETILPKFTSLDFYGGITAGVEQVIRVVEGEPLPAPSARSGRGIGDVQQYAPMLFILALAVGGVLRATLGKVPGSLLTGGLVAVIAWFVVGAISMALIAGVVALFLTLMGGGMLGRGMGGYYGGGGRGGHGGGGFSGGGGGFGGGGATGRW
ncbi:TPM domain-containing protein [Rhodoferax sp.]|uniref:TPM domain-containing protein n=1 Tax=Rhodoferax sp. TaxID=50421 RepID=UPI0027676FD6|nr:TPM domain-containing protein [Rhodoferax sp.]